MFVHAKFSKFFAYKKEQQTTQNDGAECRHDMRPSEQLQSVSGVDSKLGLTMG